MYCLKRLTFISIFKKIKLKAKSSLAVLGDFPAVFMGS